MDNAGVAAANALLSSASVAALHVADPEPAGRPIPKDPDALLFTAEAAYLAGLSPRTFEKLRGAGGGCRFALLGRAVRYRRGDVLDRIATQMRRSTSDDGGTVEVAPTTGSLLVSIIEEVLNRSESAAEGFDGTAAQLLTKLNEVSQDSEERKARWWPATTSQLASELRRIGGVLRARGIVLERHKRREGREYTCYLRLRHASELAA
jgi:hypothetical protein